MNPLTYAHGAMPPHARVGAFVANTDALGWAFAFLRTFPDADVYIVGGTVRDSILGKYPHSIHTLVRDITPPQLTRWLSKNGNVERTSTQRWHFTPRGSRERVEIALPQGRHVEEDLRNRDFTVNAIAFSLKNGRIFDPFNGMSDLVLGRIRTVNNPHQQLHAEPHAIPRALRLAAQLGAHIEARTWDALSQLGHHLHRTDHDEHGSAHFVIPRKEIGKDFLLGLKHHPHYFLKLLRESGLLDHATPELRALDHIQHPDGESGWTKTERILHTLSQPSHLRAYGLAVPSLALLIAGLVLFFDDQARSNLLNLVARLHLHDVNDRRADFSVEHANWLINHALELEHTLPKNITPAWAEKLFKRQRGAELLALLHAKHVVEGAHPEKREHFYGLTKLRDTVQRSLSAPTLLRGRDLVALGIAPGPHLRSILSRIRDTQLQGHLTSRPAALDFARYLIYGKQI